MEFGENVPWLSMRQSEAFFDYFLLSIGQVQNTFSQQPTASHTFVVYHLLIDIGQFVWSCVVRGNLDRQVIQFSKQ